MLIKPVSDRIEDLLFDANRRFGDKVAIKSTAEDNDVTFKDWLNDSIDFARWISTKSNHKNGPIILLSSNSYSFICALFAGFIAGRTVIPINPNIKSDLLNFIIKDSKPALALIGDYCDIELFENSKCMAFYLEEIMGKLKKTTNKKLVGKLINERQKKTTDIALIIYTSGSTELPKGVVCPHRQVLFSVNVINSILSNSPTDVILCGMPFSFDYGLYQIFLSLHSGATLVIAPDYSIPMVIPYWLEKFKVTGFPGTPSLFQMLIETRLLERNNFSHLRYITSTGDVFTTKIILELQNLFPSISIFPMYGLTECKRVSILSPADFKGHEGSVGKPLPGTRAFVVDKNNKRLKANEVGELVVEGPHVMSGYLNNTDENKIHFKSDVLSNNTLLYTGDQFKIDSEGFLYFIGRKQGVLKIRDQRVSPIALENSLNDIPYIIQSIIVSVKDSYNRDRVFVFVRPEKDGNINAQKISNISRSHLPITLSPNQVIIYNRPFPITKNGKIDRSEMKQIALRIFDNETIV